MRHVTALLAALLVVTLAAPTVLAFCGFYVAKADTKLFNQASQVVLVRHDDKTVITMAKPSAVSRAQMSPTTAVRCSRCR